MSKLQKSMGWVSLVASIILTVAETLRSSPPPVGPNVPSPPPEP